MDEEIEKIDVVQKEVKSVTNEEYKNDFEKFSSDLIVFEVTEQKTILINNFYQALESIPATSVESERFFSIVGNFLNKKRSRMSFKTLNSIVILNFYYRSQK